MRKITIFTMIASLFITFTVVSAESEATNTVSVSVLSGEFTTVMPEMELGEKIDKGTYKVNMSNLEITDFRGYETDYEIQINFTVYDKNGNVNPYATLNSGKVKLKTDWEKIPDFYSIAMISGEKKPLVQNRFKTYSGEFVFEYEDVVVSGIEDGDQIEITFTLIN